MNFKFEKSDGLGLLTFDGELTAERSNGLKEALMISMDNAEHVIVNFEKVTRIDRSCIRLFCIAFKKSKRLKKRLTLTGIHPETYERVKEIAGYYLPVNDLMDGDTSSMRMAGSAVK